jgi:hypothetical protein
VPPREGKTGEATSVGGEVRRPGKDERGVVDGGRKRKKERDNVVPCVGLC